MEALKPRIKADLNAYLERVATHDQLSPVA